MFWQVYFQDFFSRATTKLKKLQMLHAFLSGLYVGWLAATILYFSDKIYHFLPSLWILLTLPLIGGLTGFLKECFVPVKEKDIAIFLDKKLNLHERLLTTSGILGKPNKTSLEQSLLVQTGNILVSKDVSPDNAIFFPFKKHLAIFAKTFAVFIIAAILPIPTLPWQRDIFISSEKSKELRQIAERASKLAELGKKSNPELSKILEETKTLAKDISKKRVNKKEELLAKISTLDEKLNSSPANLDDPKKLTDEGKKLLAEMEKIITKNQSITKKNQTKETAQVQPMPKGASCPNPGNNGGKNTNNGQFKPTTVSQSQKKNGAQKNLPADYGKGSSTKETNKNTKAKPNNISVNRQNSKTSNWKETYIPRYEPKRDSFPFASAEAKGKMEKDTKVYILPGTERLEDNSKSFEQYNNYNSSSSARPVTGGGGGEVESYDIPPAYSNAVQSYFNTQKE